MNFKHIFPTFRNRFQFVRGQLRKWSKNRHFDRGLNLGTGEGDYDGMIAAYVKELIGCDVNEADLIHARRMNKSVMNLKYETNDALNLSYPDGNFDLVVSSEVIEHVGRPDQMIREIARVLAPGGVAILTFPSREFPFTYDPVNRAWQWLRGVKGREYLINQGAYAFGHTYLIGSADFRQWVNDAGLELEEFRPLSGPLVGLVEMYWTGIAQGLFKKNSGNLSGQTDAQIEADSGLRPATGSEPLLAKLTDALIWIDDLWFGIAGSSVGKGAVLRKRL